MIEEITVREREGIEALVLAHALPDEREVRPRDRRVKAPGLAVHARVAAEALAEALPRDAEGRSPEVEPGEVHVRAMGERGEGKGRVGEGGEQGVVGHALGLPRLRGARQHHRRYRVTKVTMTRRTIERAQTGARIERRLLLVLKALAAAKDMSVGDLLEGIVLHAFEGRSPFGAESLATIRALRTAYGLDLTAEDSHLLVDGNAKRPRQRKV